MHDLDFADPLLAECPRTISASVLAFLPANGSFWPGGKTGPSESTDTENVSF
jgi:hypothetical protein